MHIGALAVAAMFPMAVCAQVNANAQPVGKLSPRFEDFRVPTPVPARKDSAVIARSDPTLPPGREETTANFQKRIRGEAKKGPNFAGHFTIVMWSCGSDCSNLAVVDLQNGKIYDTPFLAARGNSRSAPESSPRADFRGYPSVQLCPRNAL